MMRPRELLRLLQIHAVLARHGFDEFIFATHLYRPFRLLLFCAPWTWFGRRQGPRGVRLREALTELGPIFVKFGQALSTRRDLLPPDIADELAKLQDQVPPFPGREARAIVERALGARVEELFASFEETALASASVAQVHAARLHDGREVVVKVLRPGVERAIARDLAVLYALARLAQRYWAEARRLRPVEVVAEFEKTLDAELDLLREAANAEQLRRNFADSKLLHVPEVHWSLTRRDVLTLERIGGVAISNIARLRAAGTDFKVLAERGVEIFFTQVFRDNFFHADMHPGNIFVDVSDPAAPRYVAVDFGIVGTLAPRDQRYLAENFLAFFERDYRRVAELHVESGWVPAGTRVDEFEAAIRAVCEPIFNRPLKDISFGQLLLRLFQTARRFNMEVQPQLVLLQKTLLQIEGLGRELYPDLDLWTTAKPFLERWMAEQLGWRATLRHMREHFPRVREALLALPELTYRTLRELEAGKLAVRWENPALDEIRDVVRTQRRHVYAAALGAAATFAGAVLVALAVAPDWLGWTLLGGGLGVLAAGWWRS